MDVNNCDISVLPHGIEAIEKTFVHVNYQNARHQIGTLIIFATDNHA